MFVIVEIFRYRKGDGWMEREKRKKGTPDQTLDIDTLYYFVWVYQRQCTLQHTYPQIRATLPYMEFAK